MEINDEKDLKIDDLPQEEKSKLFKVWKTLNKMMEDRGYEKNDNSDIKFEQFISKLKQENGMNGIFTKIDKSNREYRFRTYYDYIPTSKINTETIKDFFGIMKKFKVDSGIIITSGKLSQQAKQKITEINTQIKIEVFSLGELVVNITEYELVPKHILLSQEEKELLLKKYRIKPSQLPKILITDPVARYL